jgi:hypothetical protein
MKILQSRISTTIIIIIIVLLDRLLRMAVVEVPLGGEDERAQVKMIVLGRGAMILLR